MECPKCGYVMDAFTKDCPRCASIAQRIPPADPDIRPQSQVNISPGLTPITPNSPVAPQPSPLQQSQQQVPTAPQQQTAPSMPPPRVSQAPPQAQAYSPSQPMNAGIPPRNPQGAELAPGYQNTSTNLPPPASGYHDYPTQPSGFEDFFSFRMMVTPMIIKIVYVVGILICFGAGIGIGIDAQRSNDSDNYALGIILGMVLIIVFNVLWRIFCEGIILFFSIHEVMASLERSQKIDTTK